MVVLYNKIVPFYTAALLPYVMHLLNPVLYFDLAPSSQRYVILECFVDLGGEGEHQLIELIFPDYIS